MIRQTLFLAFITLCATFVTAQNCVPRDVQNLILHTNGTLSWTRSPQETCIITLFHINIRRDDQDYNLYVEDTSVDVSFIPHCETWLFTVYALNEDLPSEGHILLARLPLPTDADLTLKTISVSRIGGRLRLTWELENDNFKNCADRFRVNINDEDTGDYYDVYVNDKYLDLDFISPCVAYEFGVRAIYNSRPSEEGPLMSIEYDNPPARQNAPILESVEAAPTYIDSIWRLDNRTVNRCPLSSFYVDGGDFFNISFPIADTPTRDPVRIHLHSLQPNIMYLVKVSIGNSAGISNATFVGLQTPDLIPDAE